MDKQCCVSEHPSHKKELPHLNRISGQVEGIKKMIEEGRYCPEILTQLRAIRAAIKSVELRILDTHLSFCVTQACLSHDEQEQKKKIEEIRELIKRFD
ncbi:Copper-sensing transcriptional repressor [Candidatus Protochlamydia naegleriophila]|uniref:Copper-sensing transcriptional repressor n=1 Tax=Candidatus Protochlamydia naegleriophila TaxID=389348 RepID=A0A0U5JCU5_9BACT|nr:metal-sensitive transcriptional regulator [Candidatus Protochlamydia naegleriophila]CUI16612.1 Copper-sensing transcriptional repressor [Candidatus Protochlamydia naegleriophila]